MGHIVSSEGIEVDSKKTEAVENLPRPLTPTNIRSSFGLAGNYHKFVDRFASIAFPLTNITQKKVKFEWSESCERGV